MAHDIEGLDLRFTSRTNWKAKITAPGYQPLVAPVTWTSVFRRAEGRTMLEVWFQNADELVEHLSRTDPFVIALAEPKSMVEGEPTSFKRFTGVFEVRSLGLEASPKSLECEVIRRLGLKNWVAPRA